MWASVPETTIDKDGDLPPGVADVRPPRDLPLEAISRIPRFAQSRPEIQLRLGVLALVRLHGFDGILIEW